MIEDTTSKGELTRQAITQAAYDLFVRQGYHGTSMRQIAESTGIALSGIYNHFAGKEAIFRSVIMTYHPFISLMPLLENLEGDSAEELLRQAAGLIVRQMEEQHGLLNLLFIELIDLEGRHMAELVDHVLPYVLRFQQRILELENYQLRAETPLTFFRSFMGFFIAYYAMNQLVAGTAAARFDTLTIDDMMDIYLYGLFTKGDPS
ncbi:MAG: TetR/AcrR family transcriptional regulator [Candidatus Promineifilaceae bacterium]